jgi:hypothetical protein
LAAIVLFGPWRHLLVFLFIVSGVFADAALVNFSSFGVQPGYFVLLLVIARTCVELVLSGEGLRRDQLRVFVPLLIFLAVATGALFAASALFDGLIKVQASRDGLGSTGTPFHFRFENYAQQLYLLSDGIGAICVAHQVGRMSPEEIRRLIRQAVLGFIFTAAGIAVWELVHFTSGVYFPATEIFHNNVGYSVSAGQTFSYGYRISGPFAEPSALGYYFAGCLLFAYRNYQFDKSMSSLAALVASVALMMISTSTAAYSFVAIFLTIIICLKGRSILSVLASWIVNGASDVQVDPRRLAFLAVVACFGAFVAIRHGDMVAGIINEFILEKHQGESFAQRSAADTMAIRVLFDSFGLGLGLGSHKANTLPMTILSNTGIAGFIAFGWFLAGCFRYSESRLIQSAKVNAAVLPMRWFVAGLVLQHCLMNPNLNVLLFWLAIGFLVGGAGAGQSGCDSDREAQRVQSASSQAGQWPALVGQTRDTRLRASPELPGSWLG